MIPSSEFRKEILLPALILTVLFLFFYGSMRAGLAVYDGNYSGLLRLRERRVNKVPFLTEDLQAKLILKDRGGYDGQWFYYMCFDPLLSKFKDDPVRYRDIVDAPPYRFSRIGFSWLVRMFTSDPEQFPKTMIHLILFFHLVGTLFLMKILNLYSRSPLWALLIILIPGFSTSLNLGLPEPIVSSLLLGGLYFYLNSRMPAAALFFAYAILTRETALILVAVVVLSNLLPKRKWKEAAIISLSVLPYLAWKFFLTWRLFPDYGWQTMIYTPGDFTYPFGGIMDVYNNWERSARNPGLLCYPIFIVLNLLFAILLLVHKRSIFSIALVLYTMLYASLNHTKIWGHIRDVERISNEGYLMLILSSLALPQNANAFLRFGFIVVFVLLFIYDLFFLSVTQFFRQGF